MAQMLAAGAARRQDVLTARDRILGLLAGLAQEGLLSQTEYGRMRGILLAPVPFHVPDSPMGQDMVTDDILKRVETAAHIHDGLRRFAHLQREELISAAHYTWGKEQLLSGVPYSHFAEVLDALAEWHQQKLASTKEVRLLVRKVFEGVTYDQLKRWLLAKHA